MITPIIFFISAVSISPFNHYGFATGIISGIYAFSFFVNGVIILFIGVYTRDTQKFGVWLYEFEKSHST